MDHKKDQEFEQTLAESELLLRGAARSASDDADLTLESILAEFGSREDGAEAAAEPEDIGLPEPRPAVRIGKTAAPAAEPPEPQPSAPPDEASSTTPAQDTVSLQEVLESTVQSVLDEGEAEEPIELLPPKRRGLFSRRRLRDTAQLYSDESGEEPQPEEELPPEPPRKRHKRIVPLFVKIILYVVIVAVVSVGAGYAAWACATDVLAFGRSSDTIQVTVPENASLDAITDMLHENGLIQYPWLFKLYCKFTHSAGRMDAGTYELAYNYDYHALVSGMTETGGTRTTVRVMLPEGATCAQIFALLEKNGVCTAEKLGESAANTQFDYWFLEDIPYGETNRLEGFLFPDTYDFYVNDDPDRVLEKLLSNFNRKFSDDASAQLETLNTALAERWTAKGYDESYIEAHRMTIYDLVTVASMIEKETASAKESSTIASVIYNRLCDPANYPYLNIDATIVYALGGIDGALTYEDTQIDSPYNTYNRTGLPAGPISNPGLSSISAALNPADTSYYYYALDDSTGLHHFSESYDEHQAFLAGQNDA